MHNSSVFGLECPITELLHQGEEQYWRRVLKLLDYAKICRFGGENEAVSFVHRRFQEFFFVESIIESGEDIEYEEYQSIVNNASMRDALVLYCEVIEEEKAKKHYNSTGRSTKQTRHSVNVGKLYKKIVHI